MNDSQYGSRPGRCPQTVTLLEELRLDEYSQITRTLYVCQHGLRREQLLQHNSITYIASLAGRGFGIHQNLIFIHAQTINGRSKI